MLEETITELCRLTKTKEESLILHDKDDAYLKNTEFKLHHYKTELLESISISCINDDDIEVDIIAYPDDSTYVMEIRIKTYYLFEAKNLAKALKDKNSTFKKVKKCILERSSACENPYDSQVIIEIEQGELKDAAGFAHSLLNAYNDKLVENKKKEDAARQKRGRNYGTIGPNGKN